jgi:hypothetical protein
MKKIILVFLFLLVTIKIYNIEVENIKPVPLLTIVVLKFKNEQKIKTFWDIESGLTSLLVEKLLVSGKYNVIVSLPLDLNEINKKIVSRFGKDYIKYAAGDYMIEVGKYYNADIVVYPEIKKFSIKNLTIMNPKVGGGNFYGVDIEFHISVVDPQYIKATHFSLSSESVGKIESEFKNLLTDGGAWYEEMLSYKEYKELSKMKFGSYEFRTSKLGQKIDFLLNQIVINIDKFVSPRTTVDETGQ